MSSFQYFSVLLKLKKSKWWGETSRNSKLSFSYRQSLIKLIVFHFIEGLEFEEKEMSFGLIKLNDMYKIIILLYVLVNCMLEL